MGETASAKGTVPKPQFMKLQEFAWDAEDDDDVRITARMQEEAVVISADFHLQGSKEMLLKILHMEMEQLASQVASCGGIVGHIKAAVECCETAVISVTLDKADVRRGKNGEISGKFAATDWESLHRSLFSAATPETVRRSSSGKVLPSLPIWLP